MAKAIQITFLLLILNSSYALASDKPKTITFHYADNLSLTLTESKFIKSKHEITHCNDSICLIDKQPLWGSDGKLPETQLTSIIFNTGKNKISLENSSMFDPLINKQAKSRFKVSHYYGDTWKIKGEFSDGAGAYHAEWLVTKDGSVRTLLGDSELLYDSFDSLFNKN